MASYTLHLGFNWNSPLIGSFWADPGERRFLQYALADGSGAPAWFRFAQDNSLAVELWDLTTTMRGAVDMTMVASMSFGPLDDSGGDQTYAPSTLVSSWGSAEQATKLVDGKDQPYLQLGDISSIGGGDSPWGPARGHYSAGSFTFSAEASYKLSFFLRVAIAGIQPPRDYLSDPEVIVGPRGG